MQSSFKVAGFEKNNYTIFNQLYSHATLLLALDFSNFVKSSFRLAVFDKNILSNIMERSFRSVLKRGMMEAVRD